MNVVNFIWKFRSIFLLFALISLSYWYYRSDNSKSLHIENLQKSLATSGTKYADLKLSSDELETELTKKDSCYRVVDSLLKVEKTKPSKVKTVTITKVAISDTTPVTLTNSDTLKSRLRLKPDSIKITPFKDNRNCIEISGYVASTDKNPSIVITSQNANIETYDVQYERRWWEFWRPKILTKTFTKCGDLQVVKIKNTDN